MGIRPDIIEHQLAHAVRDPNGRAYNRTALLLGRREMMQEWDDYLERLKAEEEPKARAAASPRTRKLQPSTPYIFPDTLRRIIRTDPSPVPEACGVARSRQVHDIVYEVIKHRAF